MAVKMTVLRKVKPCARVHRHGRFGGICCMHFQDWKLFHLEDSATASSETSVSYSNLVGSHRRGHKCSLELSPFRDLSGARAFVTVFKKAKFLTARCHNANFRQAYVRENAKLLNVITDGRRVSIVFLHIRNFLSSGAVIACNRPCPIGRHV
jgi:hypothetical protein